MSDKFTVRSRIREYTVEFTDHLEALKSHAGEGSFLVLDKKVDGLCGEKIRASFSRDKVLVIRADEESKTLRNCHGLIEEIIPRYRSTYFSHVIGGYSAGYYSYSWSEQLDSDAYEAFKESGDIFNKEIAAKFREHVLSKGRLEEAAVLYRNFRGKDPSIEALLRNRGFI